VIFLHLPGIGLVGFADHRFQRRNDLAFLHFLPGNHHFPVFNAPGRFHNGMVALFQVVLSRGKIIDFTGPFEPDSYDGNQ